MTGTIASAIPRPYHPAPSRSHAGMVMARAKITVRQRSTMSCHKCLLSILTRIIRAGYRVSGFFGNSQSMPSTKKDGHHG